MNEAEYRHAHNSESLTLLKGKLGAGFLEAAQREASERRVGNGQVR